MHRGVAIEVTAEYVARLVRAYPCIREVWLFGSRANGRARPGSDWDYIVMADDDSLLNSLCQARSLKETGVDLFVKAWGSHAMAPWCEPGEQQKLLNFDNVPGNLDWRPVSESEAEYSATKECDPPESGTDTWRERAQRVYVRCD